MINDAFATGAAVNVSAIPFGGFLLGFLGRQLMHQDSW
jgi:hypothetical protein